MEKDTYEHLRDAGYMSDGTVDRKKLATAAAELLAGRPVATSEEIDSKALIASEVRAALLGDAPSEEVEADEDQLIRQLMTPRSNGAIQRALANGHVLCAARIERRLETAEGGFITVKKSAAFVTGEPDLIDEHHWQPQIARAESAAKEIRERIELGVGRVPLLAARQSATLLEARRKVDEQLEVEAGS